MEESSGSWTNDRCAFYLIQSFPVLQFPLGLRYYDCHRSGLPRSTFQLIRRGTALFRTSESGRRRIRLGPVRSELTRDSEGVCFALSFTLVPRTSSS